MKIEFSSLVLIMVFCMGCQRTTGLEEKAFDLTKSDGHEQGNGTDNPPSGFGGAWLLGDDKEIKYCLEASSDFGIDPQTITRDLERAFDIWKKYIVDKDINDKLEESFLDGLESRYPEGIPPVLTEKSKLFRLPIVSRAMDHCDGSENIKFYFGAESELIQHLKKSYFNPTAFSSRTEFDPKTGLGKGVVWLSKQGGLREYKGEYRGEYPNWTLPNRLLGILLHEISHFYGIGHIEGTIMQQNMFGLLLGSERTTQDQAVTEHLMSHIDHEKELFLPEFDKNKRAYQGKMTFRTRVKPELARPEIEENFEFITGKKPVGKVVSKYRNKQMFISDETSTYQFSMAMDTDHSYSSIQSIFLTERYWGYNGAMHLVGSANFLIHTSSKSTVGEIEAQSGIKVPILIQQNLNFYPMRITYIRNGQQKALMVMDSW